MSQNSRSVHTPPPGHGRGTPNPSAPGHLGTAGLPVGHDARSALREAMSRGKSIPCFGGQLFWAEDYHKNPLICHAIQSTDAEQIQSRSYWYHCTRRMRDVDFLSYEGSFDLGRGTIVYTFSIKKNYISMRQLMERSDRQNHRTSVFKKLVELLWSYKQELNNDGSKYAALLSISLDTVFMDPKGRVYLLPLICSNNQFPKGYPLEAGTDEEDDRTDLYTAALLALQVASGCEYESRAEHRRMKPELVDNEVMRCLCLFPTGRYNLTQVHNILNAAGAAESEKPRTGHRDKPKDRAGDPIRPRDSSSGRRDDEPADAAKDEQPAAPPAPGGILGLLKRVRNFIAAPADQVTGTSDLPDDSQPVPGRAYQNASDPQDDYDYYDDQEDEGGYDDESDDAIPQHSGQASPAGGSTISYPASAPADQEESFLDGDEIAFGEHY